MSQGVLASLAAPGDWTWQRLGHLVQRRRDAGRPELQPLSVFLDGGVVPRSERQADNHNRLGADLSAYLVVNPGDLVFNKLRTWQGGFGHSDYTGIVSPAYFVLRPHRAEARFLDYLLHSAAYLQELTRRSKWMPPSQFDIAWEDLRGLPVALPGIEQQRRIADFLDAETARIDALIAAKERMMRIAKARYRSVVVGDTASLGPVKLKRLATLVDCKHRTPEYAPEGFPVVSPGDVTPGELDLSVCHRFVGRDDWSDLTDGPRRPRRGDIVYSRNASIGLAALVNTDEPFCMGQDVCLVRPLRHDADGRYLTHVLNTVGLDQIDQLKVGSTFFRVNVAQIADLEVPTASEGVQNEMVERWDRVLAWISGLTATLTRQIELLRERRQALITAAVTGELEV